MSGPIRFVGLPPVQPLTESRPGDGVGGSLGGMANTPRGESFTDALTRAIEDVNTDVHQADEAVAAVTTGRSRNLHEMMIALDRADVSFRLLTRVRNKAMDAYQEIMRMNI